MSSTDTEWRVREALDAHPGAADLVLEVLRPELKERDARVRYWETCRNGYADENKALIRERNQLRKEIADSAELTASEARAEVDRLSTELYYAQDAVSFVGEMCTIREAREKGPEAEVMVSTAEVREWLKGARCARMIAVDATLVPATRPEQDAEILTEALRLEVRKALKASGRSQASVARELQVSTKYLNQMLQGHAKITLWWAARILRCCGMRLTIGEVTP
ncbi:helix-turn-helix domain-containing protein [Streptomyces sp. NPDC048288]|uniref:helix-turn-helix domain-containing protein n=1 Tax=Streptomyces sp. NPDC048288 TaxID=3365529 RepID=UPI0037119025